MTATETLQQRCARLERDTLLAIASADADRPASLAPFDELLAERWSDGRPAIEAPIVGQLCNFAPDELILAAGAMPARLDLGCSMLAERGSLAVSADVCAVVRSAAGAAAEWTWPVAPDLLVLPTPCDGKRKLAGRLAGREEVFTLEIPPSRERSSARAFWYAEIDRLIARLKALTGQRITRGRLRDAVALCNRRTEVLRRLNRLRQAERPPIRGIDVFVVLQAGFLAAPARWLELTEALLAELEQRVADGKGAHPRARLLLTGSPVLWPDFKLLQIVTEAGADVVCDDLCSGSERLYHPTVVDEWTRRGLVRAVADKALLPCDCPCFIGEGRTLDRVLERVNEYRADGVLHHTQRLCQLYEVEAISLGAELRERKIPWLQVKAELDPEERTRLRNRIDAFVEMIASPA